MVINLDVFSIGILRDFSTLLDLALEADLTRTSELKKHIADHIEMAADAIPETESPKPTVCPSCGNAQLRMIAPLDGLKRRGCRNCYYSEVVD